MKKIKSNINPSRRKFLTGSATVAGVAAASALVPIKVSYANHTASDAKGLPGFIKWKKRSSLIIHSDKTMETHREAIGSSVITRIQMRSAKTQVLLARTLARTLASINTGV